MNWLSFPCRSQMLNACWCLLSFRDHIKLWSLMPYVFHVCTCVHIYIYITDRLHIYIYITDRYIKSIFKSWLNYSTCTLYIFLDFQQRLQINVPTGTFQFQTLKFAGPFPMPLGETWSLVASESNPRSSWDPAASSCQQQIDDSNVFLHVSQNEACPHLLVYMTYSCFRVKMRPTWYSITNCGTRSSGSLWTHCYVFIWFILFSGCYA